MGLWRQVRDGMVAVAVAGALLICGGSVASAQSTGPLEAARAALTAAQATDPEGEAARMAEWALIRVLNREDRAAEAVPHLRHLLAQEQRDRPDAKDTFRVQSELLLALSKTGEAEAALALAWDGHARTLALFGADDRLTQDFGVGLSSALAATGRYEEAEPLLRAEFEADMARGRAGGGTQAARGTGYLLARVYDGLGRATDAHAIRLLIADGGDDDADTLEGRIDALLQAGDKVGAEPLARKLVRMRDAEGDARGLRQARIRLARSLFHSTDDVADDPRIVEAEALYRGLYADHPAGAEPTAAVVAELGDLLIMTADPDTPRQDEGLRLAEQSVDIMTRVAGADHPATLDRLATVAVYQFGLMKFDAAAASTARLQAAADRGVTLPVAAIANAVSVDAMLALQDDDRAGAWRRLSRASALIHDRALTASVRDDSRAQLKSVAFIDRVQVTVGWALAHPPTP